MVLLRTEYVSIASIDLDTESHGRLNLFLRGSFRMHSHRTPLEWSFPCGTWFQTRVRISVFLPLILVLSCIQLKDLQLGLIFSGVLLVSVLIHEFGHVLAARMTGGSGEEILLWPLGGLAYVRSANTLRSRLLTPAAGPLFNLLLCLISLAALLPSGRTEGIFNLFAFPVSALSDVWITDLQKMIFWTNLLLLAINIIPIFPMDGGQILKVLLSRKFSGELVSDLYIKIGMAFGLVGLIGGVIVNITFLVFLGAVVLLMNLMESYNLRASDGYDDSFMGYDFSQGYTSLEGDTEAAPRPRRLSWWQQRRERRRAEKLRYEQEQELEAEQKLDSLLEKVHTAGIESLTDSERRLLDRASDRFRNKGNKTT